VVKALDSVAFSSSLRIESPWVQIILWSHVGDEIKSYQIRVERHLTWVRSLILQGWYTKWPNLENFPS
jgi:hypothetical protein